MSDLCILKSLDSSELSDYSGMTFPAYRHLLSSKKAYGAAAILNLECIGLVLGLKTGEDLEILSIFVKKKHRGQGVANALVDEFFKYADVFMKKPFSCTVIYEDTHKAAPTLDKIFDKHGFSEPEPRCRVFRCDKKIGNMPWLDRYDFIPENFSIKKWANLDNKTRDTLLQENRTKPFFPNELSPFRNPEIMEPINSLVLIRNDIIVGWSITHRPEKDLIRYSNIFIREKFRGTGLAIILLMHSIALHVRNKKLAEKIPKACFVVYHSNPFMMKMINKRVKKYAISVSESRSRKKIFS